MTNKKEIYFSCFTPFQLITSIYYANKLSNIHKVLIWQDFSNYEIDESKYNRFFDEIITIPYYLDNNFLIKQIKKSLNAGYLFHISALGKRIKLISNSIFIIFSDQEPTVNKQMKIVKNGYRNSVILIEEGMGTYCDDPKKLPLKVKIIFALLGMKNVPYIGASGEISAMFVKHPEFMRKERYKCRNYIIQNNIFLENDFINLFKINAIKTNPSLKKKILFLSAPIEEINISSKDYINCLNQISGLLTNEYEIIVKPHPRENISYFKDIKGITLLNSKEIQTIPFELIAMKFQFDAVITVISSAAFNTYEMQQNTKLIYIYKLFKNILFDENTVESYLNLPNVYSIDKIEKINEVLTNNIKQRIIKKNEDLDIQYLNKLIQGSIDEQ